MINIVAGLGLVTVGFLFARRDRRRRAQDDGILEWYKGPVSKRRVAELRKKLGVCRGLLYEISDDMEDFGQADGEDHLTKILRTIDETADT